jgi:hypothetical protein
MWKYDTSRSIIVTRTTLVLRDDRDPLALRLVRARLAEAGIAPVPPLAHMLLRAAPFLPSSKRRVGVDRDEFECRHGARCARPRRDFIAADAALLARTRRAVLVRRLLDVELVVERAQEDERVRLAVGARRRRRAAAARGHALVPRLVVRVRAGPHSEPKYSALISSTTPLRERLGSDLMIAHTSEKVCERREDEK